MVQGILSQYYNLFFVISKDPTHANNYFYFYIDKAFRLHTCMKVNVNYININWCTTHEPPFFVNSGSKCCPDNPDTCIQFVQHRTQSSTFSFILVGCSLVSVPTNHGYSRVITMESSIFHVLVKCTYMHFSCSLLWFCLGFQSIHFIY